MSEDRGMHFGSFLMGALFGGLIGAGYAILNAPQSGEETRRRLRSAAQEIQSKTRQALETAREHGQTVVSEVADRAQNIKEEAQQAVDVAMREGKATVAETKRIARKGVKDITDDMEPSMPE